MLSFHACKFNLEKESEASQHLGVTEWHAGRDARRQPWNCPLKFAVAVPSTSTLPNGHLSAKHLPRERLMGCLKGSMTLQALGGGWICLAVGTASEGSSPLLEVEITHTHTHYGNPMVHSVTRQTISSYKKLMHNSATSEVWQTAFGEEFGRMAQGCNKTGQKGTNAMFVMTHDEIMHAPAVKNLFYLHKSSHWLPSAERWSPPHLNHCGGNLINYEDNAFVWRANIDTEKLYLDSVVSTKNERYTCLEIKKKYLTAALEYIEYMKIPLLIFPLWMIEQYNLKTLALDGWVYIEMRRAVWGFL
jgi:hypothetical protein